MDISVCECLKAYQCIIVFDLMVSIRLCITNHTDTEYSVQQNTL